MKILHSGSFLDRDDNGIKVTFYKTADINISKSIFIFTWEGGYADITVWSESGQAKMDTGEFDYVSVSPSRFYESDIPGSQFKKRTYRISVAESNGLDERKMSLRVYLENDDSEFVDVYIRQEKYVNPNPNPNPYPDGEEGLHNYGINVSKSSLDFSKESGYADISVWSETEQASLKWQSGDFISVSWSRFFETDIAGSQFKMRNYRISVAENTGVSKRSGVIRAYLDNDESKYIDVPVNQEGAAVLSNIRVKDGISHSIKLYKDDFYYYQSDNDYKLKINMNKIVDYDEGNTLVVSYNSSYVDRYDSKTGYLYLIDDVKNINLPNNGIKILVTVYTKEDPTHKVGLYVNYVNKIRPIEEYKNIL